MADKMSRVIRILSTKERSLYKAINNEDVMAAKQLIEGDGVDVNVQDVLDKTPLMYACMLSDKEEQANIVNLLLKKGANVNLRDKHGRTALMVLSKENPESVPIMEILLKRKADPNIQDENGDTALMHAIQVDNIEAVEALLDHGKANVNIRNIEDDYPLFLAAKQQNTDICDVLIKKGGADASQIPPFLKKNLQSEGNQDQFEECRKNAQDIPANPYGTQMNDNNLNDSKKLEEDKLKGEAKMKEEAQAKKEAKEKAKAEELAKEKEKEKAKAEALAKEKAKAEELAKEKEKEKAKAEALAKEKAKAEELEKEEAKAKAAAEERAKAATLTKEEKERAEAKAREETKTKEEAMAKEEAKAKAAAEEKARAEKLQKEEQESNKEEENEAKEAKTNWQTARKKGISAPSHTVKHNKVMRSKADLKVYKTKSGRTIYPNSTVDKQYDHISEIRDGIQTGPKRKGKKGQITSVTDAALMRKKRTVISTS